MLTRCELPVHELCFCKNSPQLICFHTKRVYTPHNIPCLLQERTKNMDNMAIKVKHIRSFLFLAFLHKHTEDGSVSVCVLVGEREQENLDSLCQVFKNKRGKEGERERERLFLTQLQPQYNLPSQAMQDPTCSVPRTKTAVGLSKKIGSI
jgi:hypothetical protein